MEDTCGSKNKSELIHIRISALIKADWKFMITSVKEGDNC
jgi:hypothetical protein